MLRRSALFFGAAGQGPFDPYKILGVKPDASKAEIKKAYHRLALRFHPDGGPEGNATRFSAVNEAYEAVKDGKWRPNSSANEQQKTAERSGGGWDPSTRMYVYEQPGSTTESYVSGNTETVLRLCMVWCFLFVTIRFFLFFLFPNRRRDTGVEGGGDVTEPTGTTPLSLSNIATGGPGAQEHQTSSRADSVHSNDEADFLWAYGGKTTATADPLSHR